MDKSWEDMTWSFYAYRLDSYESESVSEEKKNIEIDVGFFVFLIYELILLLQC